MNNREAYEKTCEEAEKYRELTRTLQKYNLVIYDSGSFLEISDEHSGELLFARRIRKKVSEC